MPAADAKYHSGPGRKNRSRLRPRPPFQGPDGGTAEQKHAKKFLYCGGGETPVPPLILSLIPRAQPGESSLCLPILSPAFSEQFLNDGARDVR